MGEARGHTFTDAFVATLRRQFRLGALRQGRCFFAEHDTEPCSGVLEAIHWISKQRIRDYLIGQQLEPDLIVLARWDPRNAELGCVGHHTRFDKTRQPPLELFYEEIPSRVLGFAGDWSLDWSLELDFPARP